APPPPAPRPVLRRLHPRRHLHRSLAARLPGLRGGGGHAPRAPLPAPHHEVARRGAQLPRPPLPAVADPAARRPDARGRRAGTGAAGSVMAVPADDLAPDGAPAEDARARPTPDGHRPTGTATRAAWRWAAPFALPYLLLGAAWVASN